MNILLSGTELKLFLEGKKEHIGSKNVGWDSLFAGITFILSTFGAKYNNFFVIQGRTIKGLCILVGVAFTVRGFYLMAQAAKNKYDYIKLYGDIQNMNEIKHPFSIVAIKDTFEKYPNRFLVYFDERWNCKFFFNYKTVERNNEENIITRLSNELKIDQSSISTKYLTERIQKKFSVSDHQEKVYEHKVYLAEVERFPDSEKENQFEIDGKQFFWMTIAEMEQDARIREVNSDVVSLIKETIA